MPVRSNLPKDVQERIEEKFKNYKVCRSCGKRNTWGAHSCRRCGNSSTSKKWYRTKSMEYRD